MKLLFLARIHPKKGVDLLLRAWARVKDEFPDWELDVVGPDNGGYLDEMRALAQALALDRTILHGLVPETAREGYYRRASLYVLPTHGESWGVTIADALAFGVPAIVGTGAPWEGVRDRDCGWWVEPDADALVALAHFAAQDRPVLLCFADLVTDLDFGRFAAHHRAGGAAITLCSHEEAHRVRLGELVAEGERVTSYLEKPVKRFLICSGIALFEPAALAVIDPDAETGLADLVNQAIAAGFAVAHWSHGARWIDVNTAEDVIAAEALFAP